MESPRSELVARDKCDAVNIDEPPGAGAPGGLPLPPLCCVGGAGGPPPLDGEGHNTSEIPGPGSPISTGNGSVIASKSMTGGATPSASSPPSWTMPLSRAPPPPEEHAFARPPALEALRMLPIAARVGAHIYGERRAGREPIFDMNGIMLQPPHPGPWAGAPMGGLGSGALGRGYRGDVRRWSIHPGRYVHRSAPAVAQLALRVARPPPADAAGGQAEVHTKVLSVLAPGPGSCRGEGQEGEGGAGRLSDWPWGVSPDSVTYHAVFPRAWTEYLEPVPGVAVVVRQLSPFLPHSYSEASLPVGLLEVEVVNLWPDRPLLGASVMLFSANDDGCGENGNEARARSCGAACADVDHSSFRLDIDEDSAAASPAAAVGVLMTRPYHVYQQPPATAPPLTGSISIAALERPGCAAASVCAMIDASVTVADYTHADGASSASRIWDEFSSTGELTDVSTTTRARARADADVIAAVCLKHSGEPVGSEALNFQFSISWDFPLVRFGSGRVLPRYYSRFFGASGRASPWMAAWALARSGDWARRVVQWQLGGAHGDESLPDFYRYTLYNELYFLVDGGSIWLNTANAAPNSATCILSDLLKAKESAHAKCVPESAQQPGHDFHTRIHVDSIAAKLLEHDDECTRSGGYAALVGQFLYLEGHEYLMYNTYDVHFYASFALLMLWPQLELSIQRDFASCVPAEDLTERLMLAHGDRKPRKLAGCVPHDLGSPSEDPFVKTNVYNFQDVSKWKDLGPKFVLQVFRDYRHTLSADFLRDLYPTVLSVMDSTREFDTDGDGMIENGGFPDQTYDIWVAKGVSAYCGGLWVAACFATSEIANILGDTETRVKYTEIGDSARTVYTRQLWNGSYFNYDDSQSSHSDSIMADMLAGNWFCRICGLPPVVTSAQAISSLRTIHNMNVITFSKLNKQNSLIGAVNGMRPDGSVDNSCLQSREVWSGVTYALAATMMEESRVIAKYLEEQHGRSDDHGMIEDKSFVFEDRYCLRSISFADLKDLSSTLEKMAFETAKGIHDGGWQKFGYWFATPEAWEYNGNYRSLGYMRPLSIWALELARIAHRPNK